MFSLRPLGPIFQQKLRSCERHNHWLKDIDDLYYTKPAPPEEQLANRGIMGVTGMANFSSCPTAPPGPPPDSNLIITMLQQIINQQNEATQICG